ncbi:MAG: formylglycine-generating enzyme family protein [Deltaproteobacteria bacterium]|nr:formylglycine-generating enzyme family protein [Deltaproteobacteria bacterium]
MMQRLCTVAVFELMLTACPTTEVADAGLPDAHAAVDSALPDAGQDAGHEDTSAGLDRIDRDAQKPDTIEMEDAGGPATPTWVPIPGGTFDMGCSPNDNGCYANESPTHSVTITAFEMTATEITQHQYQMTMGSNPSNHHGCPTCPVEQITYQQALDYCTAIGGRLPTEAEWEYAARAGTTTKYYCGDDDACLDGIAWYAANSGSESHPVGEKAVNLFGLYDVLGNVHEWTADWYGAGYYAVSPAQDPTGPASGSERVYRGGSYLNSITNPNANHVRVSYRAKLNPNLDYSNHGARCAR